jgi:hypothetical protein
MILRGSMGLGDAIYLYPVIKYFVDRGEDVTILTRYPEIFAPLKCKAVLEKDFLDCSCSARTILPETNIFEDTLIMAGIKEKLPLKFEYQKSVDFKIHTSKKICVVRVPTTPAKGEEDAKIMTPDKSVFQNIINSFRDRVYFVALGQQKNCDIKLSGVDLDMTATDKLADLFAIIDAAEIVLTQPGHFVPIAEALSKKLLTVFARAGLESQEKRFRFTTPAKILTRQESVWCIDDEPTEKYLKKFEALIND